MMAPGRIEDSAFRNYRDSAPPRFGESAHNRLQQIPMKATLIRIGMILFVSRGFVFAEEPGWKGRGGYRVLVDVPPVRDAERAEDEMVAKFELDLRQLFPEAPTDQRIDLHSLQVIRQDAPAAAFPKHVQQHSPGDRPFRFYDRELLDEFPTWRRYASLESLGGRPMFNMTERLPFGHRVFNSVGEHVSGTLVWAHTQTANEQSLYGIYFDLIPKARSLTSPPAGWIGDGSNRIAAVTQMAGPPGNNSASVVDWNGDGLPDLLYGLSSGYVVVAENTGSHEQPAFDRRRILFDTSGKPIDAGYDSSPLAVDWNGDGVRDLLIGAEKGCILYFKNTGTDAEPAFEYKDFVKADGEMLLTPNCFAICCRPSSVVRKRSTDVREITLSALTFESCVRMSS